MAINIQFCGAARTVTGSKHLLTIDGKKILVDCGMFQGSRELQERNWQPLPVGPKEIDAIVLTHAHMDHIGYLPKLVAEGYNGPIYATPATIGLCRVSLPDSGRIQEEDFEYKARKGYLHPGQTGPLYNEKQAFAALKNMKPIHYWDFNDLPGGASWRYMPAGHILGSAFAEIYFPNGERIMMSGDLGRFNTPIIKDPTMVEFAEYLVIESTYGDRIHSTEDPKDRLDVILNDAIQNGRCVIVPSFSIGRTQELLFFIKALQDEGRLGRIPVFVDSPMATSASRLYFDAADEHDKDMKIALSENDNPMEPDRLEYVRDREQSKALNSRSGPLVIIAGSGMANGGRVVHHLRTRLPDPSTFVLFTGYQAEGTLGRRMIEGAEEIEIFGQPVRVNAEVDKLNSLSAHCDQGEMMTWLRGFKTPPKKTFVVHGEPTAQEVLKEKIVAELGWDVVIPEHMEEFELV